MSIVLLVSFLFCLIQVQGQGTPIPINISYNLNLLNAERQFWGIPILLWNKDLQTLAQTHADTCSFPIPPFASTSTEYAAITGVTFNQFTDPLTRVGEIHAAGTVSTGISTDYFLSFFNQTFLARSRDDYDCLGDTCITQQLGQCLVYKQVVWKDSQFVGCAISNCPATLPDPQDFIVCLFTSNGNWNGEKTFGVNQTQVCAHTYVPQPPQPQPAACGPINCTAGCQNPDKNQNASCDATTGFWVFTGDTDAANLYAIQCPIVINGNLIGQGNLSLTLCASIKANSVLLQAGSRIDIDLAGKSGIVDNFYVGPVLTFTAGGAVGTTVNTYGVYSPNQQLCSQLVSSSTATYVRFFACDADTNLASPPSLPAGNLPDNTPTSSATAGAGSASAPTPPPPNAGNVAPPPNNGGGGGGGGPLPVWAIVIIVIVCIIVFILLVVLIIWGIITCMKGKEEERY